MLYYTYMLTIQNSSCPSSIPNGVGHLILQHAVIIISIKVTVEHATVLPAAQICTIGNVRGSLRRDSIHVAHIEIDAIKCNVI